MGAFPNIFNTFHEGIFEYFAQAEEFQMWPKIPYLLARSRSVAENLRNLCFAASARLSWGPIGLCIFGLCICYIIWSDWLAPAFNSMWAKRPCTALELFSCCYIADFLSGDSETTLEVAVALQASPIVL
eukprot:4809500-Karenia_brevis.AAC.1